MTTPVQHPGGNVVIDTNILISGLLFDGPPADIARLWRAGTIQPFCSKEIIEEYLRVLAYPKFQLTESEIDYLLTREILPWFEVVQAKQGKRYVKKDPDDDKFIWCALAAKAHAIISGDAHLLRFKKSPVPVVSATDFLNQTTGR